LANAVNPKDIVQTVREFMRNEGVSFKEAEEVIVKYEARLEDRNLVWSTM